MSAIQIKRHNSGIAGPPPSLRSGELAYDAIGDKLYVGRGDNGVGMANVIWLVGGNGAFGSLVSPVFIGTPTAPTPAVDDNSFKLATTAYVSQQVSADAPLMDGVADAGDSIRLARADHTHPSDTSRAPIASPGFTGTPTAPTPAGAVNNTQLATTEFVHSLVDSVINGAPGALDTLLELSDALGDDANFAATITSALALKAPLASPGFTGTPTAPTPAVDTNNTQMATTAFVIGQASAVGDGTPAMDSAAARGVSNHFARADHIHPSDTVKADVNSPTFTGTPTAPTPAVDDNSFKLATTAYVLGQASVVGDGVPVMDGIAERGASIHFARADHIHPIDTSRAPLASPAFTGTPVAPTPDIADNSTKLATTAFVFNLFSGGAVLAVAGAGIEVVDNVVSVIGFSGIDNGAMLKKSGTGLGQASAGVDYSTPSTTIDGGVF